MAYTAHVNPEDTIRRLKKENQQLREQVERESEINDSIARDYAEAVSINKQLKDTCV